MAVKDGLPATDFSRMNRKYIKAIVEEAGGGGGLPEITEADEGKVLTVDDGEAAWATAGGGGGGGAFLITPTVGETRVTLDKTCAEIEEAFAAGLSCVFIQEIEEKLNRCVLYMVTHSEQAEDPPYAYTFNYFDADQISYMTFIADTASDYPYLEFGG